MYVYTWCMWTIPCHRKYSRPTTVLSSLISFWFGIIGVYRARICLFSFAVFICSCSTRLQWMNTVDKNACSIWMCLSLYTHTNPHTYTYTTTHIHNCDQPFIFRIFIYIRKREYNMKQQHENENLMANNFDVKSFGCCFHTICVDRRRLVVRLSRFS